MKCKILAKLRRGRKIAQNFERLGTYLYELEHGTAILCAGANCYRLEYRVLKIGTAILCAQVQTFTNWSI